MNPESWRDGSSVLADYKRLNDLIGKKQYTDKVKADPIEIMSRYGGLLTRGASESLSPRDPGQAPAEECGEQPGCSDVGILCNREFRTVGICGHVDYVGGSSVGRDRQKGVRAGKYGTIFPHLPEIEAAVDAASDHAALFVELNL